MAKPTEGTIIFGAVAVFVAVLVNANFASVEFAILSIGCWINKALEELKE